MTDIDNLLVAPWTQLPLVHETTKLFPAPTMDALDDHFSSLMAGYFAPQNSTVLFLGDSYTNQNGGTPGAPSLSGRGFYAWAGALSGSRFQPVNGGIGGDTLGMMRARLAALLTTHQPFHVHLLGGLNDGYLGVPIATSLAELHTIVAMVREAHATLSIGTVTGRATLTGPEFASISAINKEIRSIAAGDVQIADYNAVMCNPADGTLKAALTFDGTHPNTLGAYEMGRVLAPILARVAPLGTRLPSVVGAEGNVIGNSRFLDGALAVNTPPTNWTQLTGAGTTYARTAWADGQTRGLQVNKVGEASSTTIVSAWVLLSTLGAAVGDLLEAGVEFEFSGINAAPTLVGNPGVLIQFGNSAGAQISAVNYFNVTSADAQTPANRAGEFLIRGQVPATAGIDRVRVHLSSYATGTYKYDRATLRKV